MIMLYEWNRNGMNTIKNVNIVNIYAPCGIRREQDLRVGLAAKLLRKMEKFCVLGYFNSIRYEEERK